VTWKVPFVCWDDPPFRHPGPAVGTVPEGTFNGGHTAAHDPCTYSPVVIGVERVDAIPVPVVKMGPKVALAATRTVGVAADASVAPAAPMTRPQ